MSLPLIRSSTDLARYPQTIAHFSDEVNFRDRHHICRTRTKTQMEVYYVQTCQVMSVLDDFARIRLYQTRASEFELLADTEQLREARLRYRIIARHYRELANREERADKARITQHLELLRLKRRQAAK
jgi:hypothetical protein